MNPADFNPDGPGELVRTLDDLLAFRPHPLPPDLQLTPGLVHACTEVGTLLGRLDGIASTLPDPRILVRSFIRREAQLSSYIENTYADYEQVARSDDAGRQIREEVRETRNAERVILAGVQAVNEHGRPVNNALLKELHALLLDGVRGHETRGRFRKKQVYLGNPAQDMRHARFVPPPSHIVPELMDDLEAFTNQRTLPTLLRLGLQHYQFETIHPFEDGNGRLGRAMILLGLCGDGILRLPVLNVSLHLERQRQRYYNALLGVSTRGDWDHWLTFFLEALRVAAVESAAKLQELLDLQRRYHARFRAAGRSALLPKIIDELFVRPSVTVADVRALTGLTYPAAKANIDKLVTGGVLRPLEGSSPARFIADEIVRVLNPVPT